MRTSLITGGSGFLGSNLLKLLAPQWHCNYTTYYTKPIFADHAVYLDIRDESQVQKVINYIKPHVIIHTAAMTSLDDCFERKKEAWETNVKGTENLVRTARQINARFIYLSTDLVFKGDKANYTEEDTIQPICYYGETKALGEKTIENLLSNYVIIRTSFLFGVSVQTCPSFTEIMIDRLSKGQSVRLFTDEYRNPIHVNNLCEIVIEFAQRDDLQGLYHVCGPERLSRFEFGKRVAITLGFDETLIEPTFAKDIPSKDIRPKDCSMDNTKAGKALRSRFWTLQQSLSEIKKYHLKYNISQVN